MILYDKMDLYVELYIILFFLEVEKMKRKLLIFLIIGVFAFSGIIGFAEAYSQNIVAWFYDIKFSMDGKQWTFLNKPFVYNGNVYISINDMASNMGLNLQADGANNTYKLDAINNNDLTLSTLKYKVDKQQLEINNLRYQLAQKETELAILKDYKRDDDDDDDDDDIDDLNDLEDMLEDDYDRYDDDEDLHFDNYTVYEKSNDDIVVKIYGEFDKYDDDWEDRDKGDFRDWIEEICEEINDEFDEDINIRVYDEDNSRIAEYDWDESDNELDDDYYEYH